VEKVKNPGNAILRMDDNGKGELHVLDERLELRIL